MKKFGSSKTMQSLSKKSLQRLNITNWDKLGVNYFGITKCANSTVKTHLYNLENNTNENRGIGIHSHTFSNYITPDIALNNNNTNFTVTRNPYSRAISIYKWVKQYNPKHWIKNGINPDWTFMELLDYIQHQKTNNVLTEVHLKTQSSFLHNINMINLDMDLLDSKWPFSFEPPKSKINVSKSVDFDLTKKQKKLIYNIYKEDFERFGYEK